MRDKYEIYGRGTIPIHRICDAFFLFRISAKKYYPFFNNYLFINIGSKFWWGWGKDEMIRIGKELVIKIENDTIEENFLRYKKDYDEGMKLTNQIFQMDLKVLSDKELINCYDVVKKAWHHETMVNIDLDAMEVHTLEHLRELIIKEAKDVIFSELTAPIYNSYVNEQHELFLNVVKGRKNIDELVKKYWWTSLGWESIDINTESTFKKQLFEYRGNPDDEIDNLRKNILKLKNRRKWLIKKYKISKKIQCYLNAFDRAAFWHDRRKEFQVKCVYAGHLILREMAKRVKISIEDAEWLNYDESVKMLQTKKIDNELINHRKKAVIFIMYKDSFKEWNGDEALILKNKIILDKSVELDYLKGEVASKGIVEGVVKVCAGAKEAHEKITYGDILVCPMTIPDYVPAMRRAAAIVTDEGGITCHAAIISREIGVPCIVGTKVATRWLKDGDKIEVDANNGIIRKIKMVD